MNTYTLEEGRQKAEGRRKEKKSGVVRSIKKTIVIFDEAGINLIDFILCVSQKNYRNIFC
ncbi:MAG: hypothetical protein F6K54_36100 [Okeania sp. SIO3B5]|uniref:hypothetical protein n=1 Tax=Okeania sp. SIO3B5 TaxID=2607811 RepID=UPI001400B85D|nr:hypothetical protein [Okeania sp. SIO3B5]NEO58008.1 hypothetical protein [Okeania sp. SIO3B5]